MSCRSSRRAGHLATLLGGLAALLSTSCSAPTPTPAPPRLPRNQEPPAVKADSLARLDNGMAIYIESGPIGSSAQIQFGVFGGSLFVAPGLAELTARVFVESTDSTAGRPSLRHRIERLGGSIDIQIGLTTTWFDIRVRQSQIARALGFLREALDSVTQSRSQIARMRNMLVAERTAEIERDPIAVATRALMQTQAGTAPYIDGLLDLDASQVSLFFSRLYRPERCVLAIRAPRRIEQIRAETGKSDQPIEQWKPGPAVPGRSDPMPRKFESGMYWAETAGRPGRARVAIVMNLPNSLAPNAAEWLVMHSCLTLDGTGGRLERFQDEADLSHLRWETHIEQTPDVAALVMSTIATPDEAVSLWRILKRARRSLVDVPPSQSELAIALRRATLDASLLRQNLATNLRLAADLKLRNVPEETLAQQLRMFQDPGTWSLARAAADYQKTPAWMVVVGAGRPEQAPNLRPFRLFPEGFEPKRAGANPAQATASNGPWLDRARAAAGGAEAFSRLEGFHSWSSTLADQAPTATDETTWEQAATPRTGKLLRVRKVLGQELTTELIADSWTESLGGTEKNLDERAARLLRHEMMRHPLMLLAAQQRGQIQFRAIAQRSSGDREMMVLEALGSEFDRLRIHIDTQSYLVRTVESWEFLPDNTLVHVEETWSDYRQSGAIRAPFRRRTTWNDGEHQTETVFQRWQPKLASR